MCFTRPTFARFATLMISAIVTTGMRTVSNLLRTTPSLVTGHPSSYHRVFCRRVWSPWRLGRALAHLVVDQFVRDGSIHLVGDDTVLEHPGRHIYGRGCHRDAIHSTRGNLNFLWGHRWVVLAIAVQFPFAKRPWALPILAILYRTRDWCTENGERYHTPQELMLGLIQVMLRWFPLRHFTFVGDGSFSGHAFARLGVRRPDRITMMGHLRDDARLYEPPRPRIKSQGGRRPMVGRRLPTPAEVVARSKPRRARVKWYGGASHSISFVTGCGHWFRGGFGGASPIRWVFVHDPANQYPDEYFFATSQALPPKAIVEAYTERWSIETTFQETRSCLHVGSTRGHRKNTVRRQTPLLFCLYTVVAVLFAGFPKAKQRIVACWPGKTDVAFSDALAAVRRQLWRECLLPATLPLAALRALNRRATNTLLGALTPVA
jgi:DDE superfamily endonuclease